MYCLFCCEISVGCLYICVAFFYSCFCCPKKQIESCKAFLDARTSVVSLWFLFFFFLCSLVLRLHKLLVWCVSTLQLLRCTRRYLSLLFAIQTFQLIVRSCLKRHLPNISNMITWWRTIRAMGARYSSWNTPGNYLLYIFTTRVLPLRVMCTMFHTKLTNIGNFFFFASLGNALCS